MADGLFVKNDEVLIYGNSKLLKQVYKGSQKIYQLIYTPGQVLFDSNQVQTTRLTIKVNGRYQIICIGAGGGGAASNFYYLDSQSTGGTGGGYSIDAKIKKGTYDVSIGGGGNGNRNIMAGGATGGTGGSSSFNGLIANGGIGGYANVQGGSHGGAGGNASTLNSSSNITIQNINWNKAGNSGNTTGIDGAHGGGGHGEGGGQSGYVKVIFLGY